MCIRDRHGEGPVAARQFDQLRVAVGPRVAEEDEPVGALASQRLAQAVPQPRVAHLVQGQIGEGDVLLQDGGVAGPFGVAMGQEDVYKRQVDQ